MSTSWTAVWKIAAKRHSTKQGYDHMSDHGHAVLEKLAMKEAAEAMAQAHGYQLVFLNI